MEARSQQLWADVVSIDAVSPLLADVAPAYIDLYLKGRWTAVAPTAGGLENAATTLRKLGLWHRTVRERNDLLLVETAADIQRAKRESKLGIILHFQGTEPVEDSLDLVDAYRGLGVRIIQLAYNTRNRVGDGAEEPGNGGLSRFGRRLIERMNAARVIVDCAHTGERTTMDAVEASAAPVILSHANSRAVYGVARNAPDEIYRAIAATGGVIGVLGYPALVGNDKHPTLEHYIAHIDHIVSVTGIDHVGIAVDYFRYQVPFASLEVAAAMHARFVSNGQWDPNTYTPPPYHYPAGFETPDKLPNLIDGLCRRGYSDADIERIMGGNWLRVYREVWSE